MQSRHNSCHQRFSALTALSSPRATTPITPEIRARAASTSPVSAPAPTGTRSTDRYTLITFLACAAVTHVACVTKTVRRPGITNARVSSRSSPFPTSCLHTRHSARPVGATLSLYTLGRVLKPVPGFRCSFILALSHAPLHTHAVRTQQASEHVHTQFHGISSVPGSMSLMVT